MRWPSIRDPDLEDDLPIAAAILLTVGCRFWWNKASWICLSAFHSCSVTRNGCSADEDCLTRISKKRRRLSADLEASSSERYSPNSSLYALLKVSLARAEILGGLLFSIADHDTSFPFTPVQDATILGTPTTPPSQPYQTSSQVSAWRLAIFLV